MPLERKLQLAHRYLASHGRGTAGPSRTQTALWDAVGGAASARPLFSAQPAMDAAEPVPPGPRQRYGRLLEGQLQLAHRYLASHGRGRAGPSRTQTTLWDAVGGAASARPSVSSQPWTRHSRSLQEPDNAMGRSWRGSFSSPIVSCTTSHGRGTAGPSRNQITLWDAVGRAASARPSVSSRPWTRHSRSLQDPDNAVGCSWRGSFSSPMFSAQPAMDAAEPVPPGTR